jgi:DNA-binding NarL/FixJ family response regulator
VPPESPALPVKILLVDDHALFRAGLAMLVREVVPDVDVRHAGSCAEGIAVARSEAFNLVFLDIGLPDGNGLEALVAMKAARPSLPVVVVTGLADRAITERAIALNAMGVVQKSASTESMLAAIGPALAGGVPLPENALPGGHASRMPLALAHWQRPGTPGWQGLPAVTDHAALGLGKRQFEALRLLVQGHPNKIIARQLDISLQGAKKHVSDLLAHFQVMSRAQLIVLIAQQGITLGTPAPSDPAADLSEPGR